MVKYNDDKIKKAILLLSFVENMDIEISKDKLDKDHKFKSAFENAIKYIDTFDNTEHEYFPDYVAKINGVTHIFEVKPYKQCIPPDKNLPRDSYAWRTYIKNLSKWEATKKFCIQNNMVFKIITEHTINKI